MKATAISDITLDGFEGNEVGRIVVRGNRGSITGREDAWSGGLAVIGAGVDAEIVEEEFLGDPVDQAFLGDFVSGRVLRGACFQVLQFLHRLFAEGGVFRAMFFHQVFEQVRTLEDDTAPGVLLYDVPEVLEEFRADEFFFERFGPIMNGVGGELNDRAGLDISPGVDVVTESGGGRAEGGAVVVEVGVDDADWFTGTDINDELAGAELFFGREREFGIRFGAGDTIDMVPAIHDPHVDEFVDPFFGEQVIDIGFTETGADACEQFVIEAVLNALHGFGVDIISTTALVADDFIAFDADQGSRISQLAKFFGNFIGNKLPIRENLKVAVGMTLENFEELGVHEGFAAKDPKEGVPHFFGFLNEPRHGFDVDFFLFGGDIDPAALAAQVATVNDRDIEEGREEFPPFEAFFVLVYGKGAFEAKVVSQFPDKSFIRLHQNAFSHFQVHKLSQFRGSSGFSEQNCVTRNFTRSIFRKHPIPQKIQGIFS